MKTAAFADAARDRAPIAATVEKKPTFIVLSKC
jgi:hypothetical protein